MTSNIFRDYAVQYADLGFAVFPLIPGSKFPFKGTNGSLNATTNLEEVAQMAAGVPNANIAIAPAFSGYFVLDEDPRNGGDESLATLPPLPETLTTNTGGGGHHFWFKRPADLDEVTCTSVGRGLDIKGLHSGYVLAPPSLHPNGSVYEWGSTAPVADAPAWLIEKILDVGEKKKTNEALSSPVEANSFLLGRAFEKIGWLGPQIKNGVFIVRCPNEGAHTSGKSFDSGTVIFAPENGGIGTFHCSHAHCVGLGKVILNRFPPDLITERDCTELAARCKETDLGNAERLGLRYGTQIRYNKPFRTWFFWNGRFWEENSAKVQEMAKDSARKIWKEIEIVEAFLLSDDDDKKKVRRAKHAKDSEKSSGIQAAITLATSAHPIGINELDANPWLLNVPNGTVDLYVGGLRPHQRENLITKIAACDFDPDARSDIWERFLIKVTNGDDELSSYIQRAVGCGLIGEAYEKCFWFIYGPPDGGKSTFISAVSGVLGDYHVASDADTWLVRQQIGGNRGDVVRLRGARLTTCVEIKKGSKFDEQLIKAVTGGDVITQAAKYKDEVSFKPTFSLWFAANDCPTIRDDDVGMWKRVRRIPFVHSIPKIEQDPGLRHRLAAPDVQRAILAWAVRGCRLWQVQGLGTCKAVEASSEAYRAEMDRLGEFFEDSCTFAPNTEVSRTSLRMAYDRWCFTNSVRNPVTPRELSERLRSQPGVTEKKLHGERMWAGVGLKPTGGQVVPLFGAGAHGGT